MKKTILTLTLASSVLALAACGDKELVVSTQYGDITKDEFYDEFKETAGNALLQNMVIEQILENNYDVSDDEVKEQVKTIKDQYGDSFEAVLASNGLTEDTLKDSIRLKLLQEKAAKDVKVTDKEIEEYYNKAKNELKVQQIVVADQDTATKVSKELKAGGDFAKLAKKYSTDTTSAKNNGDLGWININDKGQTFFDTAYALKLNTVSEPVQSEGKYYIIKVTDKRENKDYGKLEDKKAEIKDAIATSKGDFNTKISELIKEAKVDIKDKDLKDALNSFSTSKEEK